MLTDKDECPGFLCEDNTCISSSQVCDGIFDCPGDDTSDENAACGILFNKLHFRKDYRKI